MLDAIAIRCALYLAEAFCAVLDALDRVERVRRRL